MIPSARQSGQNRLGEMLSDLVQAESSGLLLGISATRAQCRDMIVPVDDSRVIQITNAGGVRRADQSMERERRRAVATRQPVDEGSGTPRVMREAHGFFGAGGSGTIDFGNGFWLGACFGVVPALARRADALSARGSM
jgi:hypothetical protein